MKQVWKRLLAAVALLALMAIFAGILFFKVAERRIASRLAPPALQRTSEINPDLSYRTLDGTLRHVSALKGKVVFLDLWGTWCIQCIAEMPTVQKLYDHYRTDPDVK